MIENRVQDLLCNFAAALQAMLAIHEHFRLDDGNQSGFLAQRGIASQRLSVGLDATPAGYIIADTNHHAPLGKTGSHLRVFHQTVAQSIQTLGYLFLRNDLPCPWHQCRL